MKKFSFDGIGINGPDEYRSRLATLCRDGSAALDSFNGSRREAGRFMERAMNCHDELVTTLQAVAYYIDAGDITLDPSDELAVKNALANARKESK